MECERALLLKAAGAGRLRNDGGGAFSARGGPGYFKSQAPGLTGGCVRPRRASYRQSLSRGTEKSTACSTCSTARKRALFFKISFLLSATFPFGSCFTQSLRQKLFYSPRQSWGGGLYR